MTWKHAVDPFLLLAAAVCGLLISGTAPDWTLEPVIYLLLASMLFFVFYTMPEGRQKSDKPFLWTVLMVNGLLAPIAAVLLGWLFLGGETALFIGFLMLMVTPCTDWYLLFTKAAGGNVRLSAGLIPINLILQLIFLSAIVLIAGGAFGFSGVAVSLMQALAVVLLPLSAAVAARAKQPGRSVPEKLPVFLLAGAVLLIFMAEGEALGQAWEQAGIVFVPGLLFFLTMSGAGYAIGKWLHMERTAHISLVFTVSARNAPLAVAFAAAAFPDEPLILLVLLAVPLLELPYLSLLTFLIKR
ncbi:arsenic resistance protein [Alkalicoccus luteus]|uniref:Arsenic resistance protein n=1 Tax=Alkalicoccus luteus TaxID=1237094 RepID=A0A969TWQ2_9BACI|nr:bile acid:sodium symporter [Alkalicoccus luteus]NJP37494.1 arsenic resistance protein [Alkalicoccus luteus]